RRTTTTRRRPRPKRTPRGPARRRPLREDGPARGHGGGAGGGGGGGKRDGRAGPLEAVRERELVRVRPEPVGGHVAVERDAEQPQVARDQRRHHEERGEPGDDPREDPPPDRAPAPDEQQQRGKRERALRAEQVGSAEQGPGQRVRRERPRRGRREKRQRDEQREQGLHEHARGLVDEQRAAGRDQRGHERGERVRERAAGEPPDDERQQD